MLRRVKHMRIRCAPLEAQIWTWLQEAVVGGAERAAAGGAEQAAGEAAGVWDWMEGLLDEAEEWVCVCGFRHDEANEVCKQCGSARHKHKGKAAENKHENSGPFSILHEGCSKCEQAQLQTESVTALLSTRDTEYSQLRGELLQMTEIAERNAEAVTAHVRREQQTQQVQLTMSLAHSTTVSPHHSVTASLYFVALSLCHWLTLPLCRPLTLPLLRALCLTM